jgi:hypothetical protein
MNFRRSILIVLSLRELRKWHFVPRNLNKAGKPTYPLLQRCQAGMLVLPCKVHVQVSVQSERVLSTPECVPEAHDLRHHQNIIDFKEKQLQLSKISLVQERLLRGIYTSYW